MSDEKRLYEMDYVYVPEGKKDFEHVHIYLTASFAGDLMLFLDSKIHIKENDLLCIVNSLQETQFRKMHTDIITDGKVVLDIDGKLWRVVFNGKDYCEYEEM